MSAAQPISIGVGQSVSVSAVQSTSLGVEQSVSVSVVQSVTGAAPSVGTLDIGRTAGPIPGAGEVPIPTTECQGNQEPPDESRASDYELVPPTGEVVTPDIESEADNLTCGQRLPSTRSSSPLDSSFEVIPDSDDNNNDKQRGVSSMQSEQVPVPPSASVGGGAVVLPPLEMAGLLAIIREDHLQDFSAVATHLRQRYHSDLDQPTLTRLLQAMSATRMDTADQVYEGLAFLTGCGTSDAETIRELLHFIGNIRRPAP